MKFYGNHCEESFLDMRTCIYSVLKIGLGRAVTIDEEEEMDILLDRLYRRETSPRENKLLKQLIEGGG